MGPTRRLGVFLVMVALTAGPVRFAHGDFGDCGQPVTFGEKPTAGDALAVLRAAVGAISCTICVCDVNADGNVTSGDALQVLRFAVGSAAAIDCLVCKAQQTIGAAGGNLTSRDGSVTLVFPPGALQGDTVVSIEEAGPSELPAELRANGDARAWRLAPDSLELAEDVSVRLAGTPVPGTGVLGEQLTLFVSLDGEVLEALQDQATVIHPPAISTSASLSHFSILGIVPLQVTARLIGVPTQTTVNQAHDLTVAVLQPSEEQVVQVAAASYVDDDFGAWQPADGFAIDEALGETLDGTFGASYDYVCASQVLVTFRARIETVIDVPGLEAAVDHSTTIETSITCDP